MIKSFYKKMTQESVLKKSAKLIGGVLESKKKMVLTVGAFVVAREVSSGITGAVNEVGEVIRREEERVDAASETFGRVNVELSDGSPEQVAIIEQAAIDILKEEANDKSTEHQPYIFSNTVVRATYELHPERSPEAKGIFHRLEEAYPNGHNTYLAFGLLRGANADCAKAQDAFTHDSGGKTDEQSLEELRSALSRCSKPVDLALEQKVVLAKDATVGYYHDGATGIRDGLSTVSQEMVGLAKRYDEAVSNYQTLKIVDGVAGLVAIALLLNYGYRWVKNLFNKNKN